MNAEGTPPEIPATLREIVEHHRVLLDRDRARMPLSELVARASDTESPRDFVGSVADRPRHPAFGVIAEVKRRSPSAGLIRPEYAADDFSPGEIARKYAIHGASAISCLTDEKFFSGSPAFLAQIKAATDLPVIRKDFILDPYRVVEARALGADAVLLIAECLDNDTIRACLETAGEQGLSVLLEIHDAIHLDRVQRAIEDSSTQALLGINNRDLSRMVTNLSHTTDLLSRVHEPSRVVSESGIRTCDDLRTLRSQGVQIALIGEHLMRQEDPGAALGAMLQDAQD